MLKRFLSITDKPQSGTQYSVRAATKTHGPAMRFIGNPGNWDDPFSSFRGGQSGQPGSSHYSDQFSYWYEGNPFLPPSAMRPRKRRGSTRSRSNQFLISPNAHAELRSRSCCAHAPALGPGRRIRCVHVFHPIATKPQAPSHLARNAQAAASARRSPRQICVCSFWTAAC